MDRWEDIVNALYTLRKQTKLRALSILGKDDDVLSFIDTLPNKEIGMYVWGCKKMEYTVHKTNGFISWKNKRVKM